MQRFILLLFPFILACGKLQGEFAFKTPLDEGYRTKMERLEFPVEEEIQWVYRFKAAPSSKNYFGVVVLKKDLSWVDVLSYSDYVDETKQFLYGTIKNFEPGDYKIVITQRKDDEVKIIDQIEFYLYSDEEYENEVDTDSP